MAIFGVHVVDQSLVNLGGGGGGVQSYFVGCCASGFLFTFDVRLLMLSLECSVNVFDKSCKSGVQDLGITAFTS